MKIIHECEVLSDLQWFILDSGSVTSFPLWTPYCCLTDQPRTWRMSGTWIFFSSSLNVFGSSPARVPPCCAYPDSKHLHIILLQSLQKIRNERSLSFSFFPLIHISLLDFLEWQTSQDKGMAKEKSFCSRRRELHNVSHPVFYPPPACPVVGWRGPMYAIDLLWYIFFY